MLIRLARRAVESSVVSLTISVLCSLILLALPVMYTLLMQNPHEIYSRFYNQDISMVSFTLTEGDVIFRGGDTVLAAPLEYFPESDFLTGNFNEIFDRLALLNNYYRDMLLPIMLLLTLICMVTLLSLSGMMAGLMGIGRKDTHALPYKTRLRVFAVSFWLPALPSVLVGFFIPVFHLLIFQIAQIYLAWRVQKLL